MNPEKEMTQEEEDMQDYQKGKEVKEGNQLISRKLSEIESRIKVACAEENYNLAGGPVLALHTHIHTHAHYMGANISNPTSGKLGVWVVMLPQLSLPLPLNEFGMAIEQEVRL